MDDLTVRMQFGRFRYVVEDKTQILHFSLFVPEMRNRFVFLGFEFYWCTNKAGKSRLFKRTSRKKLKTLKAPLTDFVKKHKYMKILGKTSRPDL